MKANCYKCVYRGTISGDAHSRCNHPEVKQSGDSFDAIIAMMSGKNIKVIRKLNIKADPVGVRSGWFMWPVNFDPVWLINCDGFKAKVE